MRSDATSKARCCGLICLLVLSMLAGGCGANRGLLQGSTNASNAPTPKSQFEQDMDGMHAAGFAYIFVLRRKDGGKMDAEDRGFIKQQTVDTKRRVSTDDDKAFLIGSNTELPPQNVAALYSRFAVASYSAPPEPNTNSTANSNK